MNESQTRIDKIDPKLYEVGWNQVPGSHILTEQGGYENASSDNIKQADPKADS